MRTDDSLRHQPLEHRPTTATLSESNIDTSSIGDDIALRKHPSLTPSSTYEDTSILTYSEPISTRTPLFPTVWQHSPDAASLGPSPSNTESPYSDRHLHYGPSSSSATGHRVRRITELAGGSDVQHTSIEEACLVRCFVKKLGRAVSL